MKKRNEKDKIAILLVDSDEICNKITRSIFNKTYPDYDCSIDCFLNAYDALQFLATDKSKEKRLVLLEIHNNSGDEWDFFDNYPTLDRGDDVYVVSASIDPNDIEKCMKFPFVKSYVTKPISIDIVKNMVETYKKDA